MADRTGLGAPAEHRDPGTLRIGSIGGVDVLVRSSWLLIAALVAYLVAPGIERVAPGMGSWKYVAGLAFAVLLTLSLLLHEISHALMAKRFGIRVRSITLHFIGGVTAIEGEPRSPKQEFAISAVGPVTSLAIAAAAYGLLQVTPGGLLSFVVGGLAGANLVVGVLNLVPGMPLDGGRVMRAAVWKLTGDPHTGTIAAGWAGRVVAVLMFMSPALIRAAGLSVDVIDYVVAFVIGWFLWSAASGAILSARIRRRLPSLQARRLARRTVTVPADLPLAEAVRRAQDSRAASVVTLAPDGSPSGIVHEAAVLATPEERRAFVPVSSVARTVEPGQALPADATGRGARPGHAASPGGRVPPRRAGRPPLRRPGHDRRRPGLQLPAGPSPRLRVQGGVPRTAPAAGAVSRLPRLPRMSEPSQPPAEQPDGASPREDAVPDVDASAWSGVHRGPFREGEWVRLTDSKGRRHNFALVAGKQFSTNRGQILHDDIIGRDEGFTITSSLGSEYLVFRPLLSEFVVSMPRGAAVVYPKDAAQIVAMADIFPGAHVVEAGVGSGALTCSLLRAVGPAGRVSSYERREEFADVARRNVDPVLRRGPSGLGAHRRRPCRGARSVQPVTPGSTGSCSTCWPRGSASTRSRRRWSPAVSLCAYVATTTQLGRTVETLRAHGGFTEPQPWETLVRDWHVEGLAVRPSHKMNGHTGFLVTARRMAPGERAPMKKRRPAPGAYGVDYSGPRPADLPPGIAEEPLAD